MYQKGNPGDTCTSIKIQKKVLFLLTSFHGQEHYVFK